MLLIRKYFTAEGEGLGGNPNSQGTGAAKTGKTKEKPSSDEKAVAKLQKELAAMRTELGSVKEQLLLMSKGVENKPADAPKIPKQGFKVDGEEYVFVTPTIQVKGLKRTALEALSDNEQYDELGGLGIKEFLVQHNSKSIKLKED